MDGKSDEPPRYPVLMSWLRGSSTAHLWAKQSTAYGTNDDPLLAAMEAILQALEAAAPLRLAGKKRCFRKDLDESNQLNLRVELVVAARLAEHGVPFEFGGRGEPDLIVTGTDPLPRIGIEITSKTKDDTARLHDELESALLATPVMVHLTMVERKLVIPSPIRSGIIEQILQVARGLVVGDTATVAITEVGARAVCAAIEETGPSRVSLEPGSDLTNHMASVEQYCLDAISTKVEQARRNGWGSTTLVAVDASRLGLAWLRPESVWAEVMRNLALDWGTLPYLGVLVMFTSLATTHVGGICIVRPDTDERERCALDRIIAAFGMPPLGGVA